MIASILPTALLAAATLFSTAAADLDPIVVKGSKFFYKTNGTEFFIKGVAYQQEYAGGGNGSTSSNTAFVDPLSDVSKCQRDIPLLQGLQTNTIRVYALDPTVNHDQCMTLLQNAGIYVVADLSEPAISINRDSPAWDTALYDRYTSVVDAMSKYNNVLGFFAGNEVSNNITNTNASPFVKAAVRDMKAYIKQKNYRQIPVGYATNDDAEIRLALADYFNCGAASDSIDFWGYNIYSWCGSKSSYTISGYDKRTAEFSNYSVPAFFAEYGCNEPSPRVFQEVGALFGPQMTPVWSGGIVYMYFQEANNYGLVTVSGNSVQKLADYTALSSQIAKATPTGVNSGSYNPTNTAARACPPAATGVDGMYWNASSTLPPTPNKQLCDCMVKSLSCVVSSSLNETKYGDLFNYLFSAGSNDGIFKSGVTGKYGAYSMCTPAQQLSWAFNNYYNAQSKASSACDFQGAAKLQTPSSQDVNSCQSIVSQAGGLSGTGTFTSAPTGTGTKKNAAPGSMVSSPRFDFGAVKIGAALLVATLSGFGLILL